MKFHSFLIPVCLLLLACSCDRAQNTPQERGAEKPNILFLFTDDHTYTALHALGNEHIITPNLDRLVDKGTTFTHAYNMGGWQPAICMASRAMIASGRSLWKVEKFRQKWKDGDTTALNQTWPRLLAGAGYDTYFSGKWHVDAPADVVFQTASHIRPGMPRDHYDFKRKPDNPMPLPVGYNRPHKGMADNWSATDTAQGGFWKGGKHWSEVLADDAVGFLETAAEDEDPFFMYVAFNAPHDPRQSPQRFLDMYPDENLPEWEEFLPLYPEYEHMGNTSYSRDEALAPFPRTRYAVRQHLREYYAIITHLDEQIGRVLEALEASGKAENTYIVFTADHGLSVGRHGLLGKQSMYDHSVRVPFVVTGPGVAAKQRIETPIYLQDVMPTTLDWAGVARPDFVEFNSLLPLLEGDESAVPYPAIYGAYIDLQRMVTKDGFKLIHYPKVDKEKLFDLEADPKEMNNLATVVKYGEKLAEMREELRRQQLIYDDPLLAQ